MSFSQRFKQVLAGSHGSGIEGDARGSALAAEGNDAREGTVLRDLCILGLLTLSIGLVFLNKAFNIDDPLFLWLGRHLESHPLDFFGFSVNWYGTKAPMHEVTQNPPLSGYYLAICGALFGRSEISLHAGYLVLTVLAVFGIHALSRRLCHSPLQSTLISILTPAFLVSATSVMCDIPMLALWVWAIVLWIRGMDRNQWSSLAGAALLASLACLTKYFAITLVPLLFAYGLARKRRLGPWIGWLAVPAVVLVGYELLTIRMYGHGLVTGATTYAQSVASGNIYLVTASVGLIFLGGCFPPTLFFAPQLWSAKTIACSLGALCLGLVVARTELRELVPESIWTQRRSHFLYDLHAGLFLLGGVSLCALAIVDVRRTRSPEALLLLLWVFGTFLFASFLNWVNNARSNVPIAPAMGILIVRHLERTSWPAALRWKRFAASFLPGAVLALVVAYGDSVWANSIRETVRTLNEDLATPGKTLHFQGHWGFQYYLERRGIEVMDVKEVMLNPGDLLVTPTNNAQVFPPPKQVGRLSREIFVAEPTWMRTCSNPDGAGFYASNIGSLPYVIGRSTADLYIVYEILHRFRYEVTNDGRQHQGDARKE